MYDEWMKDMPIITSIDKKKIKKVATIDLEPIQKTIIDNRDDKEKEPLHIIEEINYPCDSLDLLQDMTNQKFKDKINEIIREVNKMMRGK